MKKAVDAFLVKQGIDLENEKYLNLVEYLSPNFGYLLLYAKFLLLHKISLSRIMELNKMITDNKQILSNNKLNPIKYNDFEKLDDDVHEVIRISENKSFTKKFISNKYKHLIDDEVVEKFGELKKHSKKHDKIQSLITSKLKGFTGIIDFKDNLNMLLNTLNDSWDLETYVEKLSNVNDVEIVKVDRGNNFIIAKILSYKASKTIGNSKWCISRSASYFNGYTSDLNVQYFIYDFNYNKNTKYSIIGATISRSGNLYSSADYNNSYVLLSDLNKYIKYLKPISENDIRKYIKNGTKVKQEYLKYFNISKNDVLKINPLYYETNKDRINKYFNGEIPLKQINFDKMNTDVYYDFIQKVDFATLVKILKIRIIHSEKVLEYLIKDDLLLNALKVDPTIKENIRTGNNKIFLKNITKYHNYLNYRPCLDKVYNENILTFINDNNIDFYFNDTYLYKEIPQIWLDLYKKYKTKLTLYIYPDNLRNYTKLDYTGLQVEISSHIGYLSEFIQFFRDMEEVGNNTLVVYRIENRHRYNDDDINAYVKKYLSNKYGYHNLPNGSLIEYLSNTSDDIKLTSSDKYIIQNSAVLTNSKKADLLFKYNVKRIMVDRYNDKKINQMLKKRHAKLVKVGK